METGRLGCIRHSRTRASVRFPVLVPTAQDLDGHGSKAHSSGVGGELLWKLPLPGTCSAVHFKRMELEKIEALAIDPDKFKSAFPKLWPAAGQVISDISIANQMDTGPSSVQIASHNPYPTLTGTGKILASA